jgi:hypothetical protein
MVTKAKNKKVSDMTEDELSHFLDQKIVNPLMVVAKGIADLKDDITSLADSKNCHP